MQLAKPCIDVGLFTNQRDAQLLFWQEKVGLEFDHLAKLGKGVHQLRHHMNGSILKINHARATLANNASPSGFQELLIARPDITTPTQLSDPDDNIVTLVPVGYLGVSGIGLRLRVTNAVRMAQFYRQAFGANSTEEGQCRLGDSVLLFEDSTDPGPASPPYQGTGYRYITVQIFDCNQEHARILALGAEEGRAPHTIGTTTRFSFVRDPDGNWIEVSQRFELTG